MDKNCKVWLFLYNQNLWWSAWQLSKLADSLGCCEVSFHCIPCSCFGTHGKEISIAILQYYFMNLAAMLEHTKILELGSRDNGYNNLTIGPTNDAHHITSKYCVKTSLWLQEANILGTEEGWREKGRRVCLRGRFYSIPFCVSYFASVDLEE